MVHSRQDENFGDYMKQLCLILAFVLLSGCTSRTNFGLCVGVGEDRDASLVYKLSHWNIFVAFILVETIVVPIVVIADQLYCPVGKK